GRRSTDPGSWRSGPGAGECRPGRDGGPRPVPARQGPASGPWASCPAGRAAVRIQPGHRRPPTGTPDTGSGSPGTGRDCLPPGLPEQDAGVMADLVAAQEVNRVPQAEQTAEEPGQEFAVQPFFQGTVPHRAACRLAPLGYAASGEFYSIMSGSAASARTGAAG